MEGTNPIPSLSQHLRIFKASGQWRMQRKNRLESYLCRLRLLWRTASSATGLRNVYEHFRIPSCRGGKCVDIGV